MIAYFIHDPERQRDTLLVPEMACAAPADSARLRAFISPQPDFAALLTGETCQFLDPEHFGIVIATRASDGDVCVVNPELWQQRMRFWLEGEGRPV